MGKNNYLSMVMKKIHERRPPLSEKEVYYNRVEQSKAGTSATAWFLSGGCQWDAEGGCTMCNHGWGRKMSDEDTVVAIRQALADLPDNTAELFLLASGSLIDTEEVSEFVRQQMYKLVKEKDIPYFAFETRSESVNREILEELKICLPHQKIGVEIGLESADPWIRKFCVNKGNELEDFLRAAALIKEYGFECLANISLGTAFLSPRQALDDAVYSAKWALEHGADTVVLFPLHIKPYTLLEWLYGKGYYKPPSLWLLVEAIYRIGHRQAEHVDISWYRNEYKDPAKMILSPDTCVNCRKMVYQGLDEYRRTRDFNIITNLRSTPCGCKDGMPETDGIPGIDMNSTKARVFDLYGRLAEDLGLTGWWNVNKVNLKAEIER